VEISASWSVKFLLALAVWAILTLLLPWGLLTTIAAHSDSTFVASRLRSGAIFDFILTGAIIVGSCLEIDSNLHRRRFPGWVLGAILGFGGIAIHQVVKAMFRPRGIVLAYWLLTVVLSILSGIACAIVTAVNGKWQDSDI
jgi:hypothetical protein